MLRTGGVGLTLPPTLSPSTLLGWLTGTWCLRREIAGLAKVQGTAWIASVGEHTADYVEHVVVLLKDGQRLQGTQHYRYEQRDHGLAVYLRPQAIGGVHRDAGIDLSREGQLFHDLVFAPGENGTLRASASHLCGEDLYLSTYVVKPEEGFTVEHVVRGPRKNYVATTRYQRLKTASQPYGDSWPGPESASNLLAL